MSFPKSKQRKDGANRHDPYSVVDAEAATGRGSKGSDEEAALLSMDRRGQEDSGDAPYVKGKGGHLHSFANLQAVPEHDETYGEESPSRALQPLSG